MAQLKDLLVNGKSKFLDIITATGIRLASGGSIHIYGGDLQLRPDSSSSNDSADIVFYYGNGLEKSRIWTDDTYDSSIGPNYRVYNENGTSLYNGTLATVGELDSYLPLAGGTMTGAAPINFTENTIDIDFRPGSSSYYSRVGYKTNGNEALVFANTNPVTSFIFKCGYTLTSEGNNWGSSVVGVPTLQMKNQSVYVNKAIDNDVTPTHNFAVSGTSRFEGSVNVTNAAANSGCVMSYDSTEECMKFTFN